ncbi:hypothetical protein [Falsirhodobacter xinxiangensis]|uniref:hypothetical protein n=1 Tax=Falsirhodobacter xinxiangensis TaxID=2530049 RepID=UPI0010AB11C3|nr:hypothetical protein [Rhodobacter xinxiangensis]
MYDFTFSTNPLQKFFHDYADAVRSAALLLGGNFWLRRVNKISATLMQPYAPTRLTLCEIQKFYDLLTLQNVCDINTDASLYFAMLDPGGSEMEDICLLTEALEDAAEAHGLPLQNSIDDVDELDFWELSA